MSDSPSSNSQHQETGNSLWQRFIHRIRPKPDSSEALHQVFADAEDNQVIGAESRIMLEGVLRMAELFTDQYAQTNYSIKEDVKNFWYFLTQVQEIRQGVRAGRHQSAE